MCGNDMPDLGHQDEVSFASEEPLFDSAPPCHHCGGLELLNMGCQLCTSFIKRTTPGGQTDIDLIMRRINMWNMGGKAMSHNITQPGCYHALGCSGRRLISWTVLSGVRVPPAPTCILLRRGISSQLIRWPSSKLPITFTCLWFRCREF